MNYAANVESDLHQEIKELEQEKKALIDALENAIWQACYRPDDKRIDSMSIRSYAEAMRLLAKHGRIEVISEYGRRIIAQLVVRE